MNIGYARVSTTDQSPALQIDALVATGCEKIFKEIKAQNFCPACTHQWTGFDKIIHYLEKKRELEALENELKQQEGFKIESED